MRGWAVSTVLAIAACGDAAPPRPPATTRTLPSLEATPAGADDAIVARVNDRPVWGSCVAAQAAATRVDAKAALGQCIDLELAAQEAEQRGLTGDPAVIEAYDQALASALVEREITDKVKTVADLPPQLVTDAFKKNEWRMSRPEYRGSFFARVETQAPAGSPEYVAAETTARAAHATLAGRADLFPPDVEAALRAAASPDQKVSTGTPDMATFGEGSRLQKYYHEPLFRIPAIGQVSPPVPGPYGWDIILYTSRLEPLERTREEVMDELFPAMRVRAFLQWAAQIGKGHVQPVPHDEAELRRLLGGEE